MLLTNVEHFLYLLNYVIKHRFLAEILADYQKVRSFFYVYTFRHILSRILIGFSLLIRLKKMTVRFDQNGRPF